MMKSQEDVKEDLIRHLQKAVRDLQKEYVRNRDVISSSELTNSLCYALEAVFLHGLIGATSEKLSSCNFWSILSEQTHKCTLADIDSLSQIRTDVGRCRVWIRLALNGCELESYLRLIFADADALRQYYEPWSFIQDAERMDLFLTSIQGLECVRFRLGHNSTVLNNWSNASLVLAGLFIASDLAHNPSPPELNGVNSFDDYELSPDDREEVRLMFRFESESSPSNGGADDEVENERSDTQSDVVVRDDPDDIDESDVLEKHGRLSSTRCTSLIMQSVGSGCGNHMQKSRSFTGETSESERTNGRMTDERTNGLMTDECTNDRTTYERTNVRMTDEMRDYRFNRIVRENLEKYPLDYDRLRLQKEAETATERGKERSKGSNGKAVEGEGGSLRSNGPGFPSGFSSRFPSCSETDGSSMEPDAFWRTLNDERWNETETGRSGGSLSDDGTPVQGNSLPRDSWISPPVVSEPNVSDAFRGKYNDHVTCELEASYGTILADYKKSMPTQMKMVTAEDLLDLFSGYVDDCSYTDDVESTKQSFESQRLTGVEIEGDWVVVDDDCPFNAEPYHVDSGSSHLLPFVTRRYTEKGLNEQGYKCGSCSKEISLGVARRCSFDGYCYCSNCLQNEAFYIPSQILFAWDFKKLRVSTENLKFLKKVYDWPLLNIEELNPKLYEMSDELNLVRDLRRQSYYLAGYMFNCSSPYSVRFWRAMNARLYYFSHIDNYSVKDLVNVHSGSFRKALQKINDSAMKHIYKCKVCSIRGYYCEICQEPKVIFPFEINDTVVCDRCRNTYHKHCKLSQELACPKCNRIEMRKASSPVDLMDLVMFTHPADVADL